MYTVFVFWKFLFFAWNLILGVDLEFDLELWAWPWELNLRLGPEFELELWPWDLNWTFDIENWTWPWPLFHRVNGATLYTTNLWNNHCFEQLKKLTPKQCRSFQSSSTTGRYEIKCMKRCVHFTNDIDLFWMTCYKNLRKIVLAPKLLGQMERHNNVSQISQKYDFELHLYPKPID